jgi:hypothetical protein
MDAGDMIGGPVPNSFSRFLSDDDLVQVRELYLQALADVERDGEDPDGAEEAADGPQATPPAS